MYQRLTDYQNFINTATLGLRKLLLETIPSRSDTEPKSSWRSHDFLVPEGEGTFGAGRVTVAPSYFMQRREVICLTTVLKGVIKNLTVIN